jgi:hypothetical protein
VKPREKAFEHRAFDPPGRAEVEDERDPREWQLPKVRRLAALAHPTLEPVIEQ